MRVKVVSDGTPSGTSIVDIATGEPLRQVRSLTWSINATGDARCILELDHVPVELEGNATVVKPEPEPQQAPPEA